MVRGGTGESVAAIALALATVLAAVFTILLCLGKTVGKGKKASGGNGTAAAARAGADRRERRVTGPASANPGGTATNPAFAPRERELSLVPTRPRDHRRATPETKKTSAPPEKKKTRASQSRSRSQSQAVGVPSGLSARLTTTAPPPSPSQSHARKSRAKVGQSFRVRTQASIAAGNVGDRVFVTGFGHGTLRYYGPDHQFTHLIKCGVELDRPIGMMGGTIRGHHYFLCEPNFGILCGVNKVTLTVSRKPRKGIQTMTALEKSTVQVLTAKDIQPESTLWTGQISRCVLGKVRHAKCQHEYANIRYLGDNITPGGRRQDVFKQVAGMFGRLSHHNVCSLIGANWNTSPFFFVMEAHQETLRPYLKRMPTEWNPKVRTQCLGMMRQVADGLAYIHSLGGVHYNLSSRHIYITRLSDKEVHLQVGDMGISKDIKDYFNMKDPQDPSGPKPIRWLAIEAMQNIKAATMSSDVWSYGVVCWEICTQAKTPYNSVKTAKLLKYLETGKRLLRLELLKQPDMVFVGEIIHLCTRALPEERPKAEVLMSALEIGMASNETDYRGQVQESDQGQTLEYESGIRSTKTEWVAGSQTRSLVRRFEKDAKHLSQMWKVGEGNFGEVFRALLTEPQMPPTPVAVKTLKDAQTKVDVADEFFSEATILSQFNDQNVLGLIGIVTATSPSMLLLEFCDFGDVKCLLDKGRTGNAELRQEEFFLLVYQVVSGMLHISDRGIVHRDLAIRNCLLARGNVLKISDMGLAREVDEQSEVYMATGGDPVPYRWTAVEAIEKFTYSEKSDVWGFAITAWEIFAMGSMPYKGLKNAELLDYLNLGFRLQQPPLYPDDAWTTILQCWNLDPRCRPSFQEIEQVYHPIFTQLTEDFPITRDVGNVIDGAARRARRDTIANGGTARRWNRKAHEDPTSTHAVYDTGNARFGAPTRLKSAVAGLYVPSRTNQHAQYVTPGSQPHTRTLREAISQGDDSDTFI